VAPSNVFRSADDKPVIIAANHDALFRRLCDAMGRPDLADDPRYATHAARFQNEDALDAEIAAWASGRPAAEIDAVLNAAGVVCAPVYSIADIFEDAHVRDRGMLVEHEDPELGRFVGPGVLPKFSSTPGGVRWTGPWQPGAHNREVFVELLGRSEDELRDLKRQGTI
jgi:formyl-CoA transferase